MHGQVRIDATQWHNWAVEWTPTHVVAFVDGREWYRTTDVSILPPGPMHLCIQLDWFPGSGSGSVQEPYMHVDWVKQYSLSLGEMVSGLVDDLRRTLGQMRNLNQPRPVVPGSGGPVATVTSATRDQSGARLAAEPVGRRLAEGSPDPPGGAPAAVPGG